MFGISAIIQQKAPGGPVATPIFSPSLIFDGDFEIGVRGTGEVDWGDGSPKESYDSTSTVTLLHTYAAFDGNIEFYGTLTALICGISAAVLSHDVVDLPREMTYYSLVTDGLVTGNVSDLPPALENITLYGSNEVTGPIADFPPNMTRVDIGGQNTISGLVIDFLRTFTWIEISGQNTISGLLSDLPPDLDGWVSITGNNTITGDLADIPANCYHVSLWGDNTIETYTAGKTWISTMDYVSCNSVGGLDETEIDNLLIDLDTSGMATGTINLDDDAHKGRTSASDTAVTNLEGRGVVVNVNMYVPAFTTSLIFDGEFEVEVSGTGEIDWGDGSAREPYDSTGDVILIHTYATFDGNIDFHGTLTKFSCLIDTAVLAHDIADLPREMETYFNSADGIITGDVANLPPALEKITLTGQNELTGATIGIPRTIRWIEISGENTISGLVSDFPQELSGWISLAGNNVVTGDFADIPPNCNHVILTGQNTIETYTAGKTWASDLNDIRCDSVGGFDEIEIDNLLIDLDASGMADGTIDLDGDAHKGRTSASDAAVASLEGRGVTVVVNMYVSHSIENMTYDDIFFNSTAETGTSLEELDFAGGYLFLSSTGEAFRYTTDDSDISLSVYDSNTGPVGQGRNLLKVVNDGDYIMTANFGGIVQVHPLATAYDLSSKENSTQQELLETDDERGYAFNIDGTKMYVVSNGDNRVYQYSVSPAYIGVLTYDNKSFDISSKVVNGGSLALSPDDKYMIIGCRTEDKLFEFEFNIINDVESCVFNAEVDISAQISIIYGIKFNVAGDKIILLDLDSDEIYQYSLNN